MSALITGAMTVIGSAAANVATKSAAKMAGASVQDVNSKSLSEYSKELQLTPIFAIEKEILNDQHMQTLVNTAISNYAGYYVVALSIDNTVNGVSVGRAAGKYNPNRDARSTASSIFGTEIIEVMTSSYKPTVSSLSGDFNLSTESKHIKLPGIIPDLPKKYLNTKEVSVSNEANDFLLEIKEEYNKGTPNATSESISQTRYDYADNKQDVIKSINELSGLGAGKLLTVDISRNGQSGQINMLLKPTLRSIKSSALVGIAGISNKPMSIRDRWVAFWDRGTIHSMWDYLTCRDLVEAHRRNLVDDTSEYYEKTHNRKVNNKVAALLTGEFSVGTVANTWIISEMTARRIESAIGGRLSTKKARDKFMEESGCMTLFVYNTDYQRVFIYNHGLDDISEVSMNYLEKKSSKEGFDMDVFKLLSQGSAPII